MTTHTRLSSLVASVLICLVGAAGHAQPKGANVTIKGEAVDLWCYMEGGDRGAAKKECATACAKAGNAIGIVDANGAVYAVSGLQDHQPARDVLIERMNEPVEVAGTLVTKGGMKMIFVKSVKVVRLDLAFLTEKSGWADRAATKMPVGACLGRRGRAEVGGGGRRGAAR